MIVFGGAVAGPSVNDVWSFDLAGGTGWNELMPAGTAPSPRQRHTAVYDGLNQRMILYGGGADGGFELGDVWELTLSAFITLASVTSVRRPLAIAQGCGRCGRVRSRYAMGVC